MVADLSIVHPGEMLTEDELLAADPEFASYMIARETEILVHQMANQNDDFIF